MLYFLILKVAYLRHCFCFPIFTIFPSLWIIFFLSLSLSLSLSLHLSLSLFLYHFYFSNIPIFVSICCNQEVEAESLLTLPKYIVLFSCFASLFAVDFYSSCKKEEFLYDFHNITVRYQFIQKNIYFHHRCISYYVIYYWRYHDHVFNNENINWIFVSWHDMNTISIYSHIV